MSAVDAYAPCPCGSGQKYKRCCQKAESYVDRAERLDANGQHEAAVAVLNEGLAKHPDAPWLSIRKALSQAALDRYDRAEEAVSELLRRQPGHFGALVLKMRILLEAGGIDAAIELLQDALERADEASRPRLAALAALLGGVLVEARLTAAGVKHLELARSLGGPEGPARVDSTLGRARSDPAASAWVKEPYRLAAAPGGLADDARARFDEAVGWAEAGLWRRAAAAFELLSAGRNLGLCRLWLGDHRGAVEALRRGLRDAPPSTVAVDLEALCQTIDEEVGPDPVEEVELTWPLRDRDGLLARLAADPRCVAARDDDDDDDDDKPASVFLLLDRPRVEAYRPDLKPSELPLVVGRVVVGDEAVALQTRDDGRLDRTIDGFTATAERTIPPAQPRTAAVGTISRADHALDVVCLPPPDASPADRRRLSAAILNEQINTAWPETPAAWLGGKTPEQAARAGGFEVPLRAALLLFEESGRDRESRFDASALRARLGVPAEPPIDHASVAVDELHLGRLALLDPKRLDDDRLLRLHRRSREYGLRGAVLAAARELTTRRGLIDRDGFPAYGVYGELALAEAGAGRREPALEWARKGRAADRKARESVAAASWDMLELQIRMGEDPEAWVPDLVVILDRYERDAPATRVVLAQLMQFGIVRLVPPEYEGEDVALDTSVLQHLIARYGPRVQTASGEVGVSAVRGGIWTPGGPSSTADKPRIILPGQ